MWRREAALRDHEKEKAFGLQYFTKMLCLHFLLIIQDTLSKKKYFSILMQYGGEDNVFEPEHSDNLFPLHLDPIYI